MSTQLIAISSGRQVQGKLSDSYRTPPWLFEWLDNEYDFDFDICASDENHLLPKYYTENNSGLGCAIVEFMLDEEPVSTIDHFVRRDDVRNLIES